MTERDFIGVMELELAAAGVAATDYLSPGSITTKDPPHRGGLVVYIPPLHHALMACPTAISTGSPVQG
jgi:hypothetical protein